MGKSTVIQTVNTTMFTNSALSTIGGARFKDAWPKKWLDVENLIRFDLSKLVYKIVLKLCPESLWTMIKLRSSLSN